MKYRSTTQPNVEYWAEPNTGPDGREYWSVVSQAKGYPATEAHDDHFTDGQAADDIARDLAGHPSRIPAGHEPADVIPTKEDELRRLQLFASAQHPRSYLGSWMKYLIPCVQQALRCDIEPTDTPDTMREHAMDQARRAAATLDEQIAAKRKQLKALDREAEQNAKFREEAIRQLRLALHHAEHA